MDRRTFLVLGSVGAATSIAGCNELSLSGQDNTNTARPDGGEEEPTEEDDNIVAEFKGSGSTVTDEFKVENAPGITIEIRYNGQKEFNSHLQFPSINSEDVLITKTSRSFTGEFYFHPDDDNMAINISIPGGEGDGEWTIEVRRDDIILSG